MGSWLIIYLFGVAYYYLPIYSDYWGVWRNWGLGGLGGLASHPNAPELHAAR